MENLIALYYFLGIFPGLVSIGLVWAVSLAHQSPISRRYLKLYGLLMVYFTQMVLVYYFLKVSPLDPFLVEGWSQPLYLLIYATFPPLAAGFFLELMQIPFKGWTRVVPWGLSGAGYALTVVLLILNPTLEGRIEAFRFWVQYVYVPVFLVFLLGLVVLQLGRLKSVSDQWKRGTVLGANILILAALPLFAIDALWPLVQMELRFVPRGFNFFGIFFVTFSLFFMVRWRKLLLVPQSEVVPSVPPRSKLDRARVAALGLTEREEEVVHRLFEGKSNQEIATTLQISLGTVKNHIYHIFQKSGASTRRELLFLLEKEEIRQESGE